MILGFKHINFYQKINSFQNNKLVNKNPVKYIFRELEQNNFFSTEINSSQEQQCSQMNIFPVTKDYFIQGKKINLFKITKDLYRVWLGICLCHR